MQDHHPIVSIVIPCRNEEKYIERCIRSILQANYPQDRVEILVCDGMSTDQSRSIVQKIEEANQNVHLLDNEMQTTPFALNLGLKKAIGEIKVILGAHAEIDPNFIIENVRVINSSEEIGCSGGIIENVYEDEPSELIGKAMSSSFGVGNAHFRTAAKEGFVDTVAFGAYKIEVFEKLGYFDEDLVRNQDDEYNFRLTKGGYRIYLSKKIRSKYYVRASLSKLYRQYFQYGYWKVFVNKKHKTITTLRQMVPLLFVLYLWLGLVFSIASPVWAYPYLLGLMFYFLMALFSALRLQSNILRALKTIRVFFILHYSYGLGYLKGIWRFMILGKKPAKSQMRSSR